MNFCNLCGEKVTQKIPDNDNRLRFVCDACGAIHYQNPNIVAGVLPLIIDTDGIEKVLLCRRAIEPRYGYWTLPAGFMENEETLEEAAAREANEEANVTLGALKLYVMMSLPRISQVYALFIGQAERDFYPGIESLETQLFTEAEIPWDDLAFPVIKQTLKKFYHDRAAVLETSALQRQILSPTLIDTFPVHQLVYPA